MTWETVRLPKSWPGVLVLIAILILALSMQLTQVYAATDFAHGNHYHKSGLEYYLFDSHYNIGSTHYHRYYHADQTTGHEDHYHTVSCSDPQRSGS